MSTSHVAFPLKPTHKPVKAYYEALAQFHKHGHTSEGNTGSALSDLLKRCAQPYSRHLLEEYPFRDTAEQPLRADGASSTTSPSSRASGKPKIPTNARKGNQRQVR